MKLVAELFLVCCELQFVQEKETREVDLQTVTPGQEKTSLQEFPYILNLTPTFSLTSQPSSGTSFQRSRAN